jgi:hypothetical protein
MLYPKLDDSRFIPMILCMCYTAIDVPRLFKMLVKSYQDSVSTRTRVLSILKLWITEYGLVSLYNQWDELMAFKGTL